MKNTVLTTALQIIFVYLNIPLRCSSSCTSPDGIEGICTLINNCPSFMEILTNTPQPFSNELQNYLRKFGCGFEENQVKVCCPEGPIINELVRFVPTNVETHPNLRLLPLDICGEVPDDANIVYGTRAKLAEFPWMALISYYNESTRVLSFRCGGSVINKRYILTAAHCLVVPTDFVIAGVRVGEHDINSLIDCETTPENETVCVPPVQDNTVEKIIVHERYNPDSKIHDIGLLRLGRDLEFKTNVLPICLPITKQLQNFKLEGKLGTVTGWGITETGKSSQVLLKTALRVTSDETCRKIYEKFNVNLTHRQLCAGGDTQSDSCEGDSGGPLQFAERYIGNDLRYFQLGVVSFGPRYCGANGIPGVYTRVAFYVDWILGQLEN